jgi:hypothetical protein
MRSNDIVKEIRIIQNEPFPEATWQAFLDEHYNTHMSLGHLFQGHRVMLVLTNRGRPHNATLRQSDQVSIHVQMLSLATAGAHHMIPVQIE